MLRRTHRDHGRRRVDLSSALGEGAVEAWFRPLRSREIDAALAAFRLDRLLGLHLAAPVARRTADGQDGIVTAVWRGSLTEGERAERELAPPNTCSPGSSVFQLMYVFDALIRNEVVAEQPDGTLTWALLIGEVLRGSEHVIDPEFRFAVRQEQ